MPLNNKQLALIHVAKTKLGITEDQYRACLVQIAGVESSKDLDRGGFEALMGFFEYMGFKPLIPRGAVYGDRPGFASSAQVQLIRELWFEYTGGGQDDTLNKWLLRTFKVSSLRFLKDGTGAQRDYRAQGDEDPRGLSLTRMTQGAARAGVPPLSVPALSDP